MVLRSFRSHVEDGPGSRLLDVKLRMLKNLNKRRNNIGIKDNLQQ